MTELLKCSGVSKSFAGQPVLRDIDLAVGDGECVVLLGPSGCGKSTLLNIITGILEADTGELTFNGRMLDAPDRGIHVPMRQRGFAMVFQDFSLWPHMTVHENVAFGLRMQGRSRSERETRTREVLAQVQMADYGERFPDKLSGGQQQRVAVARALAVQPRLLLLDEPLSALDARLREDLKHELARLLRETGLTAVYVTHDQVEAYTLGDRIALMRDGVIEQTGSPEDIYAQPATSFVAGFLGTSNLLPYQRENGHLLVGGELPVAIDGAGAGAAEAGHMLVRREAVCVSPDGACCRDGHYVELSAVCDQYNFIGEYHEAFAHLDNGLVMRGYAHGRLNPGERVRVRFPSDAVRFIE